MPVNGDFSCVPIIPPRHGVIMEPFPDYFNYIISVYFSILNEYKQHHIKLLNILDINDNLYRW